MLIVLLVLKLTGVLGWRGQTASWPHTGRLPRIMAQPGVALHDAFPLVPPLSPVELAMTADA